MLYLIDLEPVDTRYTAQWRKHLPKQLDKAGIPNTIISGGYVPPPTPGTFLNFAGTNKYKSQQLEKISNLFMEGKIKDNDYFLYTDAWNPTVLQLKYTADLLGIKIKIGGMWHAGSYDPQDFLGRLIGDVPWVRNAESAMFHCYDHNFFASEFHLKLFLKELFGEEDINAWKEVYPGTLLVGWPMEYLYDELAYYLVTNKQNKILFPHRIAPEKQPEIFKDLAESMADYDYEWVMAQETKLTKEQYHTLLGESKIVFSANLQETLGISVFEGAMTGAFPLMPNRLSYKEMWPEGALYPSEWTESWESYLKYKDKLIDLISRIIENFDNNMIVESRRIAEGVSEKYFNGKEIYKTIIDSTT